MRDVLKDAINYWRKHPMEFLGDLIGCLSLFVMFWALLIIF